jgi:armadillo repeat-containing protein 6
MAKVITQETFDDVVKENIVEFSMGVEESKEETIKQFEAQGIHLGNIIKDLRLNEETGEPVLKECIEVLQKQLSGESVLSFEEEVKNMETLAEECNKVIEESFFFECGKANNINSNSVCSTSRFGF